MGAVARTVVASPVPRVGDGHTPQVGAHTEDDDPLGLDHAILVVLGVTQLGQIHSLLRGDLLLRAVADEQRLAPPLEGDILALGDITELDLDFGQGQDVRGRAHGGHELGDYRLGGVERHDGGGAGHQVGEGLPRLGALLGGLVGVLDLGAAVVGEVRDLDVRVGQADPTGAWELYTTTTTKTKV